MQPLFEFLHISLHIPEDVPGSVPLDSGHVYLDWSFWKVQTDKISQFKEKSGQSEASPEDIERYRNDSMMRLKLKTIEIQYLRSEMNENPSCNVMILIESNPSELGNTSRAASFDNNTLR